MVSSRATGQSLNEFILIGNAGENRWRGQGPVIEDLEFCVKSYLALFRQFVFAVYPF